MQHAQRDKTSVTSVRIYEPLWDTTRAAHVILVYMPDTAETDERSHHIQSAQVPSLGMFRRNWIHRVTLAQRSTNLY